MNKSVKIILTISLSSAIILSLSSCFFNGSQTESGKTNNSNTNESNNDNSDGSGDNESSDKNSNNLERFVSSMGKKNFTYRTEGESTVRVDGNLIEVGDNTFNDIYESTTDEFNQPVQYFYDYSNGKYVKDFYEASSDNVFKKVESFVSDLTKLCWEPANGTTYKCDKTTLEILSANSARLTVNGKITSITKIGENNLKTPNASMVDDKTISGSANPSNPSNPSQSSPLIYDAGTKKWDLNLFKDTLLKWAGKDNNFSKIIRNRNLDNIIFINAENKSDINFGLITSDAKTSIKSYNLFYASENFLNFINNGKNISADGLTEFIDGGIKNWLDLNRGTATVTVEYDKDNATSDQKKTFEAMTKNILNKFSPDGKKAEVLYWMKQPVTSKDGISSLYKFCDTWEERFIVSVDGDVQMWNIGVTSSTYYGTGVAYENVANDPSGELWQTHPVLGGPDKIDIDDRNIELYSNTKSYSPTK